MATTKNSVFIGTFIHSERLTTLQYLHNTAVFVSQDGKIVHLEPNCALPRAKEILIPRLGWDSENVEITVAKEGQFFFPGFIGKLGAPNSKSAADI